MSGLVIDPYRFAATWTPADLSPYLWLDASQETYGDGDAVSTWTNRGSGANNATAGAGTEPTFKTGIMNGQPVVRFDGSNDFMSVASYAPASTTAGQMSVWVVMTATSGSSYAIAELTSNYNWANTFGLFRLAAGNVALRTHTSGSSFSTFETTGTVTTTPSVYVGTMDRSLSTNEVTGYLNSTTASGTRPQNDNLSGDMSTDTLYLGARAGSSLRLAGDIAEIGFVKSVLSASDITSLTSYLGAKYGVTIS